MTVEQQVDALATSVDELKTAVVTKKATLDATVVDAQSATEQAQAAKVNALSARDQAGAFKDAAYSAAQSAASAVAFQDLTALAAEKAVTAVDVFIYDTSKDSDGGAWRHRCAGTSWFNEPLNTATRGARRDFPAVAVIVAEADKVTIYDADDPALPMWRVWSFAGMTIRAVDARDNKIVIATSIGLAVIALVSDRIAAALTFTAATSPALVSANCNDVAMTVLPDAPIDPATGLPVPTIAVATDGGVSVIKDDGTVVDIPTSGTATNWVGFNAHNQLVSKGNYDDRWVLREIPATDVANLEIGDATFVAKPYRQYGQSADYQRQVNFGDTYASDLGNLKNGLLLEYGAGSALGITSLVALTTSSYATGWLPGDIRGAFLADTDDTDLVGSGELVTNGTFDTDTSGWTPSYNASLSIVSNRLRVTNDSDTNASAYQDFTTVTGKTYLVSLEQTQLSSRLLVGTPTNISNALVTAFLTGTNLFTFVATGTTTRLTLQSAAGAVGQYSDFDNISVKLADADRSVNNNGLIVNGTVTRSPVATGAELVAYSGFSPSNYLEQPYNPDLDFGTGDFCIMGWVKPDDTAARTFISYEGPDGWQLNHYAGDLRFWEYTPSAGNRLLASTTASTALQFICIVINGGVASMYVNGALVASGATTIRSFSNGTLRVGKAHSFLGYNAENSQLSLLRISATAPTADQILKIYNDEKVLFQENAACTLYGASDAVTALAHDPDTGLLHVGTSAGRSVFKGLRRVANTTVPVGAAIAAAGGMVVEE